MGKRKGGARQALRHPRFATAAEAIRFAIEELPAVRALGAWMQVGDQRFDGDDIQRLYESNDYPTATASVGLIASGPWVSLIVAEDFQGFDAVAPSRASLANTRA